MARRNLLHQSKLADFKRWCEENGMETRPGKGEYQVLQVKTERHGWLPVYKKLDAKEHLSVEQKLEWVVRMYLLSTKGA